MSVVLIAAGALLCGVSMGAVLGFIMGWHFFCPKKSEEEPKIEEWGV